MQTSILCNFPIKSARKIPKLVRGQAFLEFLGGYVQLAQLFWSQFGIKSFNSWYSLFFFFLHWVFIAVHEILQLYRIEV